MARKNELKLQNMVAKAELFVSIPLELVAEKLERAEYNPEQFPGLVLKLDRNGATALLFTSGRIVVVGVKSEKEIKEAVREVIKKLGKLGIKVTKRPKIELQNVVASGDIHMKPNLDELAFKLENTEYEPEQFPGLIYKLPNSSITFLIFSTGRIVIVGGKSMEEIKQSVRKLKRILKKYIR